MCAKTTMEEFEALLNESFEIDTPEEGSVVKGKVIAIEAGQAIIDVGYKMEGRVELKEFANPGEAPQIEVGDDVEVYLRNVENARGDVFRRTYFHGGIDWRAVRFCVQHEHEVLGGNSSWCEGIAFGVRGNARPLASTRQGALSLVASSSARARG